MKAVLVITERDNVATALEPLEAGRQLEVHGSRITTVEPIASGHKVALRSIAAGEPVIKYGSPIGIATVEIVAGAHVHTHNLSSTRGRGDLRSNTDAADPRLAEPPDEPSTPAPGSGGPSSIPTASPHEQRPREADSSAPRGGRAV